MGNGGSAGSTGKAPSSSKEEEDHTKQNAIDMHCSCSPSKDLTTLESRLDCVASSFITLEQYKQLGGIYGDTFRYMQQTQLPRSDLCMLEVVAIDRAYTARRREQRLQADRHTKQAADDPELTMTLDDYVQVRQAELEAVYEEALRRQAGIQQVDGEDDELISAPRRNSMACPLPASPLGNRVVLAGLSSSLQAVDKFFGSLQAHVDDLRPVMSYMTSSSPVVDPQLSCKFSTEKNRDYFVSIDQRHQFLAERTQFQSREDIVRGLKYLGELYSVVTSPFVGYMNMRIAEYLKSAGSTDHAVEQLDVHLPQLVREFHEQVRSAEPMGTELEALRHRIAALYRSSTASSSQPTAQGAVSPLTTIPGTIAKLMHLLGGGIRSIAADDRNLTGESAASPDDQTLSEALCLPTLTRVTLVAKLLGFDGSHGMHTELEARSCAAVMRVMFQGIGALPFCGAGDSKNKDCPKEMKDWIQMLPVYALSNESKRILYYVFSVLCSQRHLTVQPVLRSCALKTTAKFLFAHREELLSCPGTRAETGSAALSWKVFPLLATDGVGLEQGEGHGPRKEFFDLCASDFTALLSPVMDITSSVDITFYNALRDVESGAFEENMGHTSKHNNNSTTGLRTLNCSKPALILQWRGEKMFHELNRGDVLVVTFESTGVSGNSTTGNADPSNHQEEQWLVECTIPSSNISCTILVLQSQNHLLPADSVLTTAAVRRCCVPPFRHETGQQYSWTNASVKDTEEERQRFFAMGWLIGNCLSNGVCMPLSLAPLCFHLIANVGAYVSASPRATSMLDFVKVLKEYPTEGKDLSLLDRSHAKAVSDVMQLRPQEFRLMMEAEGIDTKISREDYIQKHLAVETVWGLGGERDVAIPLWAELMCGVTLSPLFHSPFIQQCSSRVLRDVICGPIDDGVSGFSFAEYFRFIEDSDMLQMEHNVVYMEMIFKAFEQDFSGPNKRQLLRFITGRVLLPPQKKLEHIKFEFPLSPMTAKEFDATVNRLPTSHSCDNVIEIPNYLECFLFGSKSIFYHVTKGVQVGDMVMRPHKRSAWSSIPQQEKDMLLVLTRNMLSLKLQQAVLQSGTYELDDAAVSKEQQAVYDASRQRSLNMELGTSDIINNKDYAILGPATQTKTPENLSPKQLPSFNRKADNTGRTGIDLYTKAAAGNNMAATPCKKLPRLPTDSTYPYPLPLGRSSALSAQSGLSNSDSSGGFFPIRNSRQAREPTVNEVVVVPAGKQSNLSPIFLRSPRKDAKTLGTSNVYNYNSPLTINPNDVHNLMSREASFRGRSVNVLNSPMRSVTPRGGENSCRSSRQGTLYVLGNGTRISESREGTLPHLASLRGIPTGQRSNQPMSLNRIPSARLTTPKYSPSHDSRNKGFH